jgi:hypothetical protein
MAEERTNGLHEIHGLSSLHRTVREGSDVSQEVLIRDRNGFVHIELQQISFGAALTPAAARYLAQQLIDAADRMEGFIKPTVEDV